MIKLAFVFKTAPHGSSISREGLDALLAATAFCDEDQLAVFFLQDGVFNVLSQQQPELILQKDFIRSFQLLDLYDIKNRFICQQSLQQFGLQHTKFIINCEKINRSLLIEKLKSAEKILSF